MPPFTLDQYKSSDISQQAEALLNLRILASDDRTTEIVEFVEENQVINRVVLDAYDFESLIYEMVKVREHLSEPVRETLDVGSRVMATTEPDITVSHTSGSSPNAIALSVRHPGVR